MPGKLDLTNCRFGSLIALEPTAERQHKSVVWKCKCDCGKIHYVAASRLKEGTIQSCGCSRKGKQIKDITGQRFGKLVAVKPTNNRLGRSVIWECQCDCGNTCYIDSHSLNKGSTQSCGCLKSKGELKIIQILSSLNILYEYQKKFESCKITNKIMPFDFFLPEYNILIEFDGEQHFHAIDFLGGEERYKKQQEYDSFKNEWSRQNGYMLIRIPYTDLKILDQEYILNILHNKVQECKEML